MSILGAIGSAISTVAGPVANYFGAKYAADKQYEIWHEQRDWNTPAAQMARYKAAGVNPYAALGQISSGNIGTMPQAPDFSGAAEGVGNVVSNAVSLASQKQGLKAQKLDNDLKEQTLESNRLNSIVGLMSAFQDLKAKQNQNSIFDTEAKIKEWSLYNLVKDYDKKGVDVGLLNHELNQRRIWDDVFNRQKFLKGSEDIRGRQLENDILGEDLHRKIFYRGTPQNFFEYAHKYGLDFLTGLIPLGGVGAIGAGLKSIPKLIRTLGKGGVSSPVLGYEWGQMLQSTMR